MVLKRLLCLLVFTVFMMPLALAQNEASLGGTVEDGSGAAIPSATITLTSHEQGTVRKAVTNEGGLYQFSFLPSGVYDVEVAAAGFKTMVTRDVSLAVAQEEKKNFSLTLGAVTESVTVAASDDQIDANDATLSTVIDNKKVAEMPLNGRLFYSLAPLTPGVMPSPQNSTNSTRGGFNIAGSCDVCNKYMLDGFLNNDMAIGTPSVRPSVDAIQEFNILTGVYPAQYGYASGGQIITITKSGTNKFHGSAFGFFRDSALDAEDYFTVGAQPAFHRDQTGGTFGGPILKDKTFFFVSYEYLNLTEAVINQETYPFAEMHSGDFSALLNAGIQLKNPNTGLPIAGNIITSGISPAGQALMNLFPTTGVNHNVGSNNEPQNDYTFQEIRPENYNAFGIKIDQTFSTRDSAVLSYNYYDDTSIETGATLTAGCEAYYLPIFTCNALHHDVIYGLSETHVFTPNLINEARAGLLWSATNNGISTDRVNFWGPYGVSPLITPTAAATRVGTEGYPNTSITGYTTFGSGNSSYYHIPAFDWYDAVSWTHGHHTVKFGTEVIHLAINTINLGDQAGTLSFTNTNQGMTSGYGLADLLFGLPASSGDTPYKYQNYYRSASPALFIQDDFKVLPTLTINLGLRWEMNTPVVDRDPVLTSFDPAKGMPTVQKGGAPITIPNPVPYEVLTTQSLWKSDKNDYAPRIGFAWQPTMLRGTTLRAGAGTYYNSPINLNNVAGFNGGVPYTLNNNFISSATASLSLADPFPSASADVANSPEGVPQSYKNPRAYTFTAGVQHLLTKDIVLDALYMGSYQNHMQSSFNLNQPSSGPGDAAQVTAREPYPNFGPITYTEFGFNGRYNSLQLKLTQNMSHNLSFLASWAYAHSIDNIGPFTDQSGRNTGSGSSSFDLRNRIVVSLVYQLPVGHGQQFLNHGIGAAILGGWQVSPLVQKQSGAPLTATLGGNYSNTDGTVDRPNMISSPNRNAPNTVREWFNTSAFTVPVASGKPGALYGFGNEPRNSINGPGLTDADLSLVRRIKVREWFNTEIRVESFDIFNHPNWGLPSLLADGSGFGTITSTVTEQNQTGGDKRSLQFAIKGTF
jgi:hypothetical protein